MFFSDMLVAHSDERKLLALLIAASGAYSIADLVCLSVCCLSLNFFEIATFFVQFLSDSHETWHT